MSLRIGFVGFGEAARAFHDTLAEADPSLVFSAWDIKLDDAALAGEVRAAMAARGVAETRPEGLAGADWIISAVTADQSLAALDDLADHLRSGQLVIDVNSVSPGRKRDSEALVTGQGAAYLDMAVMAPVHPRGHRTPVLCAGAGLASAEAGLDRLGFDWRRAGAAAGQATAIKMCRSMFVKGLEALTVETLLAASASGCFDEIAESLAGSYPGLGWPGFAAYEFERTLRHGRRRAAEMREVAATYDELGLAGSLAAEIARVQDLMAESGAPAPDEQALAEGIARVLAARRGGG